MANNTRFGKRFFVGPGARAGNRGNDFRFQPDMAFKTRALGIPSQKGSRPASAAGMAGHRMTRGQFLRTAGLAGGAVAAAGIGLGGIAKAQVVPTEENSCIVYPTGDPGVDVPALYEAFYGFTNVLLKATTSGPNPEPRAFELGSESIYYDQSSVAAPDAAKNLFVAGEIVNGSKTTIRGGVNPFQLFGQMGQGTGPTIELANISFDSPTGFGIYALFYMSLRISFCDVMNLLPNYDGSGNVDTWSPLFGILAHINGSLSIQNCHVELNPDCSKSFCANGIHYSGFPEWFAGPDLGGADVSITGTTVVGSYADPSLAGAYPDSFFPPHLGICAVEFIPEVFTKAMVAGNTVTAESGITCWGMQNGPLIQSNRIMGVRYIGVRTTFDPILGTPNMLNNAVISNNTITMAGDLPQFGLKSCAMSLAGSANQITANNISGYGDFGAYVSGQSSDNFFNGNNMASLKVPFPPEGALYFFDVNASGNTVRGYTGGNNTLVIDRGQGNSVTGVK